MAQSVAPAFLLQVPAGWSLVGKQVIRQIDNFFVTVVKLAP